MINKESLSPMMQHYLSVKEQYPDCFVFYRIGDFYEMFFEDAVEGSKILELTLTGKECGLKERAPMCGVPYHSVDTYVQRMIDKGKKVAICEQVEDPALVKGGELVKRSVIRVITPGTVIEEKLLDSSRNNYIMSVFLCESGCGYAYSDVSTGAFFAGEVANADVNCVLSDELARISPSECICNASFESEISISARFKVETYLETMPEALYKSQRAVKLLIDHYEVNSLDGFGFKDQKMAPIAAGALLQYLYDTQKNALKHLQIPKLISRADYIRLDTVTRKNLEITESIRNGEKKGFTLFSLLDKTETAPGKRKLRSFIDRPLYTVDAINERLDAVTELVYTQINRDKIKNILGGIYDIERLSSKIAYRSITPRDCVSLQKSLQKLPALLDILGQLNASAFIRIRKCIDPMEGLCDYLEKAIIADPPVNMKDGGYIRPGYDSRVDELRDIRDNSQAWLASILEKERTNTGIKNLKIGFNKVFGYYLEVTKSFATLVPDYYERKQTLTGAERYITPELKEVEHKLLTAGDELIRLESSLYDEIRDKLFSFISTLQTDADNIAEVDVYQSLAQCACDNHYVRPEIADDGVIDIRESRHPIVEKSISNGFIPNDVYLDGRDNRLLIITGPNMAGKSTYMRQTALIVLMASIGSFVPASSAHITLVDQIFTRIGASDDLSSGQSTFMVEMNEVANILNNATRKSLLILDEIGRGTSTYDGLSIAWAVLERIASFDKCGAKALFATHYHELSELEGQLAGVKNYRVLVKEYGDDVLFLRKIARGSADKSFGIQVAKLAGIPQEVIDRAKEILRALEKKDSAHPVINSAVSDVNADNPFRNSELKVLNELSELNTDALTPLEALNIISRLHDSLK